MAIFPAELILKILYSSDPQDIIRWRTVSKWFRTITCNDMLWKDLYTDSPFPRPPGPSPSQSRSFLERMLVQSAQFAWSWTTRPLREVSSIKIKLGQPLATTPTKLISGRWLVGCEEARRFVLHDADPCAKTQARKVFWEHEEPIVSAWDVHSVSPVVGQSVVYVLLKMSVIGQTQLLEFQLNNESGEIYNSATIDPPTWASSSLSMVKLDGGKSRFFYILTEDSESVVFDTQTRGFYAHPHSRVPLEHTFSENVNRYRLRGFQVEFTDAHIISLHHYLRHRYYSIYLSLTLIQFFAIPSDGCWVQGGKPTLCLTHEGFLKRDLRNARIMKPWVDTVTGDTNIRLLVYFPVDGDLRVTYIDLVLPKPSSLEVSPIAVNEIDIWIPTEGLGMKLEDCLFLDLDDHTRLRGFYVVRPSQTLFDPINTQHTTKFMLDIRRDPPAWDTATDDVFPIKLREALDTKEDHTGRSLVFDGLRGRLCYEVGPEARDEIEVMEIE